MAAKWRMLPPEATKSGNPATVLGRTYSCAPSAFLDVPDFDGHYLRSAGWYLLGIVGQNTAPSSITGDTKVQVLLSPPSGSNVTQLFGMSGTVYNVASGYVTVTVAGDVTAALDAGWSMAKLQDRWWSTSGAGGNGPVALNTSLVVGLVALSGVGGGLTVAAQPDYMRKLTAQTSPGTISIAGGTLVVTGIDNTGQAVTDSINLSATAGAGHTYTLSHGYQHVTSASVAGLSMTGGATICVGTTGAFCLPLPPNFSNLVVQKAIMDNTDIAINSVTVDATVGSVFWPTAPDTTRAFACGYTYIQPGTN